MTLNDGSIAIIDIEFAETAAKYNWSAYKTPHGLIYARRRDYKNGGYMTLTSLVGVPPTGMLWDHIDGNPLDCRKSNLRLATPLNNSHNRRRFQGKSKFKGVTARNCGTWRARITFNKTRVHLGDFKTEIEAAKAYNDAALVAFGEFAVLNELGKFDEPKS